MTENANPNKHPPRKELDYYRSSLKDWAGREEEYVLIKGESTVGFFSSDDDALKFA